MSTPGTDVATRNGQLSGLAIRPGQEIFNAKQRAGLAVLGIKDCDDAELAVFMHYCQKTQLDPFSKQIYYIGRRNKEKWQDENGRWQEQWVTKWTIQVGIDGFRVIRDRIVDRLGITVEYEDTIWYDADGGEHDVWLWDHAPAAAKVTVLRNGKRYPAVVRTASYMQTKNGEPVSQWKTQPDHMIEKCLPGGARIQTDRGSLRIRDIVKNRLPVRVRSIDLETGAECWQPVVNWWRNGLTREWVQIWAPNGSRGNKPLRLTPNHPLWTPAGWKDAGDIGPGDMVAVASPVLSAEQDQVIRGGLLGDGSLGGRRRPSSLPHYDEAHAIAQRGYLEWKAVALANLGAAVTAQTYMADGRPHPGVRMRTRALPALYGYREQKPNEWLAGLDDLGFAVWFMDDGAIKATGGKSGSVSMALHCCGFGADFADEAAAWLATRYGVSARVLRRDRNPYVVIGAAGSQRLLSLLAPYIRHEGTRKVWIAEPVIPTAPDGFAFVPVLAAGRVTGKHQEQRYDIEVEGTHTFIVGGIVVSNCAEAFALRRAFPHDLGGIYIPEEVPRDEPGEVTAAVRITAEDVTNRRQPRQQRESRGDWADQPARMAGAAARGEAMPPPADSPAEAERPPSRASSGQVGIIGSHFKRLGFEDHERDERLVYTGRLADWPADLDSTKDLDQEHASRAIGRLNGIKDRAELVAVCLRLEQDAAGEPGPGEDEPDAEAGQ